MKKKQWNLLRIKHALWCLVGKHVWQRPMFIRLNSLPGEEDFKCHFCGKHKTFFNRKETIWVMPNNLLTDEKRNQGTIRVKPERSVSP